MRKNLTKNDIIEAFRCIQEILDCNAIEYMILGNYSISRLKIIEWLKLIGKYNDDSYIKYARSMTNNLYTDEELRDDITDRKLENYSFLDIDSEFAGEQYPSDGSNTGYELAAEFLLSDYCTDEEFHAFMDDLLSDNWDEEEDEDDEDYDYDDYIHPTEEQKEEIETMRKRIFE